MTDRTTFTALSVGPVTGNDFMDNVAAHLGRLYDASALPLTDVGGTGDAVTATVDPVLADAPVTGMKFTVTWAAANTGAVTLSINGATPVAVVDANGDALTTGALAVGARALIEFVGTAFRVLVASGAGGGALARVRTIITASTTWVKPTGYPDDWPVMVEAWGGGGGGARGGTGVGGGGGGGYSRAIFRYADLPVSVGIAIAAGGAGRTSSNGNGLNGGNTTFGSLLTAFGGGGGAIATSTVADGGGGGGMVSAGALAVAGKVGGGSGARTVHAENIYGGGAGYSGDAAFGGGGGGKAAGTVQTGGISLFGGNGGNGGTLPTQGSAPSGGGGSGASVNGADGARGEVRIWL